MKDKALKTIDVVCVVLGLIFEIVLLPAKVVKAILNIISITTK